MDPPHLPPMTARTSPDEDRRGGAAEPAPFHFPAERWEKYKDPTTGRWWYWCPDPRECFWEDAPPQKWNRYCNVDGRDWWWNDATGGYFFDDRATWNSTERSSLVGSGVENHNLVLALGAVDWEEKVEEEEEEEEEKYLRFFFGFVRDVRHGFFPAQAVPPALNHVLTDRNRYGV